MTILSLRGDIRTWTWNDMFSDWAVVSFLSVLFSNIYRNVASTNSAIPPNLRVFPRCQICSYRINTWSWTMRNLPQSQSTSRVERHSSGNRESNPTLWLECQRSTDELFPQFKDKAGFKPATSCLTLWTYVSKHYCLCLLALYHWATYLCLPMLSNHRLLGKFDSIPSNAIDR